MGRLCGFVWLACFAWLVWLCTRVELGGFRACGVFAFLLSVFPLLCLPFHLFTCFLFFTLSALFWLSFACPLVLSCLFLCPCGFCCCFFFPFGLHAKREGAPCWCVLSSCVVSVQILVTLSKNSVAVALARSNSFG